MGVGSVGGYWVVLLRRVDCGEKFADDLGEEGELLGGVLTDI